MAMELAGPASADAPERLLQIPRDSIAPGPGAGELDNPRDIAGDPDTCHLFVSERNNDRISEFTAWGEFVKAWGRNVAPDDAPGDTVSDQFEICTTACQAGSEGGGGGQFSDPMGLTVDDAGNIYVFDGASSNHRVQKFSPAGEFLLAFGGDVVAEGPDDSSNDELQEVTVAANGGTFSLSFEGESTGDLPFNASAAEVQAALNSLSTISGPGGSVSVSGGPGDEAGSSPYAVVFGGRFAGDDVALLAAAGNLTGAAPSVSVATANDGGAAEICKAVDLCQGGVIGTADGYFSNDSFNNFIVHNPVTGTIFVGDVGRIQEFDLNGGFESKIVFEGALAAFKDREVRGLEVDSAGNLYMALGDPAFEASLDNVHKLSPAGALLSPTFPVKAPFAIAVDPEDNVYAIESQSRVLGFDASGAPIDGMEPTDGFASEGVSLIGLGTNLCDGSELPGNLYVSYFQFGQKAFVNAYGTPPTGCEPGPVEAPRIDEEYAVSVDTEGAVVKAEIDPNLGNDTTFFVQYGTAECRDSGWESGCATSAVTNLTEGFSDFALTTEGVFLGDLEPATTYFYRFVAQSGGGTALGAGNSFRTFARQTAPTPGCPANAHLRTGAAAFLPDCRAYEMVSPLDKNNGDIRVPEDPKNLYPISLFQAAAAGGGFTYSSSIAFGEVEGAPLTAQYLARRDPAQGWLSDAISPPRTRLVGEFLDPEFKQFSEDLCQAWLRHDSDPPLTADAVPGYLNLYRIDYCAGGDYEALTTQEPPDVSCFPDPGKCPLRYVPLELQGTSADGSKAIYVANDNLADAPANNDFGGRAQLYFFADGNLRFVCIRPNGTPSPAPQGCAAGTYGNTSGSDAGNGRLSSLQNAISADGSLVYWSEGPKTTAALGQIEPRRLFVREHPEQGAIGAQECSGPGKACTYAVSDEVSPGARSHFWGAADDGSKAIFTIEDGTLAGNLYQFDLASAKAGATANTLIAEDVRGVMGVSEDATRVYFVSTEDLDEDGEAQEGELNLYFHDSQAGGFAFIGALVPTDLIAGANEAPIQKAPHYRTSRVTPDGAHAVFTTPAPLTGRDNRDAVSGERDTQVFLYDAGDDKLICASCNPSGARPSGREVDLDAGFSPWIGARIPGWERALYASRVLSADGQRLFFESFDALVPRDTNGEQDVYQWEAVGKGDCDEADSGFAPANGGCVELISSGESQRESTFFDASTSGDDVFFATLSSLVPQDFGLVDLYDARVGGGFPPPPAAPEPCEGEACQGPSALPEEQTPASRSFEGAGNVKPKARKRCGKGKRRVVRKGKARCMRKKGKRANGNRRTGR